MADSKKIDYTVNFKTQTKELKEGLAEIRKAQAETQKNAKAFSQLEEKRVKRSTGYAKEERKRQKEERAHIAALTSAHNKLHATQVSNLRKQATAVQQAQRQQAQQAKRLQQQQGGGVGGRGGGRGGAGAGGQGAGQQKAGFGSTISTAIGTFVGNAALAAFNLVRSAATSGYEQYMQYGQALAKNIGIAPGSAVHRGIRNAMGGSLGFSLAESAAQAPIMARATGEISPRELQQGMRATGLEAGDVGGLYHTLARAGYDFSGAGPGRKQSQGGKEFQRLIEYGMASGLKRGRLPEYLEGVQRIVEEQRANTTGQVDASSVGKLLTLFGRTGLPGMQGAAGAGVLAKLNNAIMNPSGDAADALTMRGFGFGTPNGRTSYYDALKRKQRGATAENLRDMVGEVSKEYGRGREGALALSNIGGISIDQAEAIMKIADNGKSMDEQLKDINKVMDSSKSLEQQSLDAMKGLGHAVQEVAKRADEGVDIGRQMAPMIEKIQDWEFEALKALIQMAKDIHEGFEWLRDKFGGGDQARVQKSLSEQEKLRDALMNARTPEEAQKIIKKMRASADEGSKMAMKLGGREAATADREMQSNVADAEALAQHNKMIYDMRHGKRMKVDLGTPVNPADVPRLDPGQLDAVWKSTAAASGWTNEAASKSGVSKRKRGTDSGTVKTPPTPPHAASGKPAAADNGGQGGNVFVFQPIVPDARIAMPKVSMSPQGGGVPAHKPSNGVH